MFWTKFWYRKPLIWVSLPRKAKTQLALSPDSFLFENPLHAEEIIQILPQMIQIASTNAVSMRAIHNFSWLCDVVAHRDCLQKNRHHLCQFLQIFLEQYQIYDPDLWAIPLLSERLMYGLYAYKRLYPEGTLLGSQELFAKTMLGHAVFLRKSLKKQRNHPDYALFLIRSAMACLCLQEERKYLQHILGLLYQHLEMVFFHDGGHVSRNSALHFRVLSELISLRDILVKAGVSISSRVQTIIAKSCDYLEFLRHPDGKFSIFNGAIEGDIQKIEQIFTKSPASVTAPQNVLREAQFYRLQMDKMFLLADFYCQNGTDFFKRIYQGALSFELSVGKKRVFVNCGSGEELGDVWRQALLKTEAHNTLSVNNYKLSLSSRKPEIVGKKNAKVISAVGHQGLILEGACAFDAVDAGGQTVGLSHYRKILLHKNGNVLQGEDWVCVQKPLFKKTPLDKNLEYCVRFHLAPDIEVKMVRSGSVMIDIDMQHQYMFTVGSGKVYLEESVYMGKGHPVKTKQIVIVVSAQNELTKIRWTMQQTQRKTKSLAMTDKVETNEMVSDFAE